jgi:multidrug transporter EmrE-like cation transporter
LSSAEVQRLYQIEGAPKVNLINLTNVVTVGFVNLIVGTDYQLQVSTNLNSWTNFGAAFTATNSFMIYTNNWNVSDWNQLFFRLH